MNCKICNGHTREIFHHTVLRKYDVAYFECDVCGLVQTEKPYWIQEAYKNPILSLDTGYATRNIYLARRTLVLFPMLFGKNGFFLDYAGGYGLLTRLMRDYGLRFLWSDLYTKNLFAQGFEHTNEKIRAVTCFECFEHFDNPREGLEKILAVTKNIFFSTKIIPSPTPQANMWEYYAFSHGQHLSFYSVRTLEYLAKKYNLQYYTDRVNLHLFTEKKIPAMRWKIILLLSRLPIEPILKRIFGSLTVQDNTDLIKKTLS